LNVLEALGRSGRHLVRAVECRRQKLSFNEQRALCSALKSLSPFARLSSKAESKKGEDVKADDVFSHAAQECAKASRHTLVRFDQLLIAVDVLIQDP